jgi:hypothetical protein
MLRLSEKDQSTSVTIIAVDANRRALADIPVTLTATSGIVSGTATSTDTQGRMTATFGLGADRGNRTVTISATSGAVTGAAGVSVTGTTVTLTASPPTALNPTTAVEISASVVDAAKVPLGGVVVSFSTTGGTLSSAVATTDSAGIAKVNLTGVTADVTVIHRANATDGPSEGRQHGAAADEPAVSWSRSDGPANPSVIGPNAAGSQLFAA